MSIKTKKISLILTSILAMFLLGYSDTTRLTASLIAFNSLVIFHLYLRVKNFKIDLQNLEMWDQKREDRNKENQQMSIQKTLLNSLKNDGQKLRVAQGLTEHYS
jgi:cell shape-determining protein MreC